MKNVGTFSTQSKMDLKTEGKSRIASAAPYGGNPLNVDPQAAVIYGVIHILLYYTFCFSPFQHYF